MDMNVHGVRLDNKFLKRSEALKTHLGMCGVLLQRCNLYATSQIVPSAYTYVRLAFANFAK